MTTNVKQIHTGCQAHGAYYIESDCEAAIVDPLREVQPYENINAVVEKGQQKRSVADVDRLLSEENPIVPDTRATGDFGAGFIPGAYNIGLRGKFANWAGVVFRDVRQPLVLVNEPGTEEEITIRLAQVGFDDICGYIECTTCDVRANSPASTSSEPPTHRSIAGGTRLIKSPLMKQSTCIAREDAARWYSLQL